MAHFIVKNEEKTQGMPIWVLLNRTVVKGDIGIEIEVEGTKLCKDNDELAPYWTYHHDGSLRGRDNAEYVLSKPIDFEKVEESLDQLWGVFKHYKSTFDDSNRTSVHVHLNCQQFYLNRLTSFACLYFAVEEILSYWCGDHRVGNLFCLRAKDAPALVSKLRRFITKDGHNDLSDGLHYSAFNVRALSKFGSIEIRLMRGVSDKETILTWCQILQRLYDMSASYPDPRDVIGLFSQRGPLGFYEELLGKNAVQVMQEIGSSQEQISDMLYEGIRISQDLAYCREWNNYEAVPIKVDPFGRKKKVASMTSSEPGMIPLEAYVTQPVFIGNSPSDWAAVLSSTNGPSVNNPPPIPSPQAIHNQNMNQLAALSAYNTAAVVATQSVPIAPSQDTDWMTDEEYESWLSDVELHDESPEPEYDEESDSEV